MRHIFLSSNTRAVHESGDRIVKSITVFDITIAPSEDQLIALENFMYENDIFAHFSYQLLIEYFNSSFQI